MSRLFKKLMFSLIFTVAVAGLLLFMTGTHAQAQGPDTLDIGNSAIGMTTPAEVETYWTAERLKNATPLPIQTAVMPAGAESLAVIQQENLPTNALPGYSASWSPNSGLSQPDPTVAYTLTQSQSDPAPQILGTAPSNPLSGPYAPFQRWTWYQNYTRQATATIGKLFFTKATGGNFVCSASVIGRSTIATAGHCVSQGNGVWHTNFLFCPSYYKAGGSGGPFPTRGCWAWSSATTSTQWHNSSAFDRDYGCIVTKTTGDTVADKIGNVTGWTGRAWNFSSQQPMFSWGYPSGPTWPAVAGIGGEGPRPFPGYHIITASSPEWYEVNMTAGDGQVSKYIGNDMTGGSSGGPWWMSISHKTAEYNDTDELASTDPPAGSGPSVPGGPFINGVNSHKRCLNDCWKPVSTAGIFWQEMGSAQFRNTTGDSNESEDIFQICLSHTNN